MNDAKMKTVEQILSDQYDTMLEDIEKDKTNVEKVEIPEKAGSEAVETHETTETEEESGNDLELKQEEVISDESEEEPEYDLPPPERWQQEWKDIYNELPPKAKKLFAEDLFKPMQRSYTQATQQIAEMRKKIEPVMEILEKHGSVFEKAGMSPIEALRRQAAWAVHMQEVGVEQGLRDMQKSFGMNGAPGQDQDFDDEFMTPTEKRLKSELDALKQWKQQSEQRMQPPTPEQRAAMAQFQQAQHDLQKFVSEQKDGKPLHPHVEKVAPQIAGLLKGGLIKKVNEYGEPISFYNQIKQAYKMACDLDPSIKSASATANRQRQVDKAKAAQDVSVVTTTPSRTTEQIPTMSLSDRVEAEFERLSRRAS